MEVWMPASCDVHSLKWQRWVEWAMNKNRAADYELAGFSWSSRVRTLNMRSGSRLRLRPQCCHVQCKGHWSHDSSIWNPQPTHKWERHCPANSCSTTKWSEMMVLWRGACDDTCGPMQVEAKILRHVALAFDSFMLMQKDEGNNATTNSGEGNSKGKDFKAEGKGKCE